MADKRELFWPIFLLVAASFWMAVYLTRVDPDPFPKWLQVVCNIALLVELGRRVWRGRFLA